MDREVVLRMAKEAGFHEGPPPDPVWHLGTYIGHDVSVDTLERFADLVAAAEREACKRRINTLIADGPLPGNGFDKTAERNGLILAYNALLT